MFRFLLKKNFADIWDNMFHLIILNLVFVGVLGLVLGIGYLLSVFSPEGGFQSIVGILYAVIACIIISISVFAEGDNCAKIAGFDAPKLKSYFTNIPSVLKDATLFGLLIGLLICVTVSSLPYYISLWAPADGSKGSMMGLLLASCVFWFLLITVIALQWFLPVRNLMHNNFGKCLRKCYIIFFDNVLFSLGCGLNNLLIFFITCVTFGIIPGVHAVTLASTNALRLRLYKYDWLEVNPDLTREEKKHVPWDELIANDKKTLGPRKFKSFIFPWKE